MKPVETNTDNPVEATTGSMSTNYSEKKAAMSSARNFQTAATETNGHENAQRHAILRFVNLWKFEVLSMVCSVGALLAIIAVLFAYDGKSMNHWNAWLRPNMVVSAL